MVCRVCEKFKTCDSPYCGDSSMVQCGYYEKAKQTNADRIRSMTDEELAECFWNICESNYKPLQGWLEWLKQECEA